MIRRDFLQILSASLALPLLGCGGTDASTGSLQATAPTLSASTRSIQGTATGIGGALRVVTAQDPGSTVQDGQFSSLLNGEGRTQLLGLVDSQGKLLGLSVAIPDPLPFSPTSTALAVLMMVPGFYTPDSGVATQRLQQVQTVPGFPALVADLNRQSLQQVLSEWSAAFFPLLPPVSPSGLVARPHPQGGLTLYNVSNRFVQLESNQGLLAHHFGPGQSLVDPKGDAATLYTVSGPGVGPGNAPGQTAELTLFFQGVLPLWNALTGSSIDYQRALELFERFGSASSQQYQDALDSRNPGDIGAGVDAYANQVVQKFAAANDNPGLATLIAGVQALRAQADAANQLPLSAPIVVIYSAPALLFYPSIIGATAGTLYGDEPATAVEGFIDFASLSLP